MIMVVDIGNSNVVFGLFDNKHCLHTWRTNTLKNESIQYYQIRLSEYFLESDIDPGKIRSIVLSSVVPDLTEKFELLLKKFDKAKFLILDRHIYKQLKVSTSNPFEMGTDLMANAIAANEMFKENKIIIDFGTALTFTLVYKNGEIGGVNIVPGLKTAIKSLSANAAQLHAVPLEIPQHVLGKTTMEAIQSGVVLGYQGLVKHMIQLIKKELAGKDCKTIATGGLSHVFASSEFDVIDKNLTLKGLAWVGQNLL